MLGVAAVAVSSSRLSQASTVRSMNSAIALLKYLADPYNQLPAITYWLLGSLTAVNRSDLLAVLPAVALGLVPLYLLRWQMNLMTLGEEEARALGVEAEHFREYRLRVITDRLERMPDLIDRLYKRYGD
jgi:ABC-type Fe3+-siderophore transport system permease subunit